jgi:hypothetical protein
VWLARLPATMNVAKQQVRRLGGLAAALGLLTLAGCAGDPGEHGKASALVQLTAPEDLAVIGAAALEPQEYAEVGLQLEPPAAEAELVGAHYAIALAGVAVVDRLTYEQLELLLLERQFDFGEVESGSLQAGPGREFLVVPLTEPESARTVLGGDSAEVIVDGEPRPLDRVPHELEVLVVNVPAGGDATLAITDAGETKTISLRTGGREAGAEEDHPADALEGAAVELEDGVAIPGVSEPGYADGLRVTVSLTPSGHLDDRGWADDGRMWLEIEFGLTLAGLVDQQAHLQLDLAESLTIVGSDGTSVTIPADAVVEPTRTADGGLAIADWSGVAEVPDTLRSFEVTYATHGTFTAPDGSELSFTQHPVTSTGTIELTER